MLNCPLLLLLNHTRCTHLVKNVLLHLTSNFDDLLIAVITITYINVPIRLKCC